MSQNCCVKFNLKLAMLKLFFFSIAASICSTILVIPFLLFDNVGTNVYLPKKVYWELVMLVAVGMVGLYMGVIVLFKLWQTFDNRLTWDREPEWALVNGSHLLFIQRIWRGLLDIGTFYIGVQFVLTDFGRYHHWEDRLAMDTNFNNWCVTWILGYLGAVVFIDLLDAFMGVRKFNILSNLYLVLKLLGHIPGYGTFYGCLFGGIGEITMFHMFCIYAFLQENEKAIKRFPMFANLATVALSVHYLVVRVFFWSYWYIMYVSDIYNYAVSYGLDWIRIVQLVFTSLMWMLSAGAGPYWTKVGMEAFVRFCRDEPAIVNPNFTRKRKTE